MSTLIVENIKNQADVNLLSPSSNIWTPGWQQLPSGLKLMWGGASSSGTAVNNCVVTLPKNMDLAVFFACAAILGSGTGTYTAQFSESTTSTVTFTVRNGNSIVSGVGLVWFAIGV